MSTSIRAKRVKTHYVRTVDGGLVLVPGHPTRSQRVVGWVVWHVPELGCVSIPAVVAMLAWPWMWLFSALVVAGWVVRDVRRARRYAAIRAGRDLPPADVDDPAGAESDVDTSSGADAVATVDATTDCGASADCEAPVGAAADARGGVWL